jgi:hypothetical protein
VQVNNWLLAWAEPEAVAEQALSAWPASDWTGHTCKHTVVFHGDGFSAF